MDNLHLYTLSSLDWSPSPILALAASPDSSQLAAARQDGSLEIWTVSPGSIGWHCQLRIHGESAGRVSSVVWSPAGRILSSTLDGGIYEWDRSSLQQKIVLDSVGVSVWQMALEPSDDSPASEKTNIASIEKGSTNHDRTGDAESSIDDDDDDESDELYTIESSNGSQQLAIACDDGCIRLFNISDKEGLTLNRTFPRVSGRMLSVTWSNDAKLIFSGSSDGLIRCWDVLSLHEAYRITAGLGGLGSGPELCVWSLLFLRSGTLVSGDSTGSVQFWDSHHGTLLQAHTYHKGDVNALATVPGQNRVFSAGSDGQVILYKCYSDGPVSEKEELHTEQMSKWVYIGYVRAHTHDVRALAMAVPISREDPLPTEKKARVRRRQKPISYSYHKWAHLGVPMLISGGDDTKLFAYSAKDFSQFAPHDICPAPQPPCINLVHNSVLGGASVMLVQTTFQLEIFVVKLDSKKGSVTPFGRKAATKLLAQIKTKDCRKIVSSAVSSTGLLYAYSDHVRCHLLQLKKNKNGKWSIEKMPLLKGLPSATFMIFSADSLHLMLAGRDGKIYIIDVNRSEIIHAFIPQRKAEDVSSPIESPITKLLTSSDGQWLTAINYFGDIFIFNLEVYRQHWFISRLNDASVSAAGFPPNNCNIFIVVTSLNEVYVLDVERKQLGEWSRQYTHCLPRRFQEFPGEVVGLCFPPSVCSSSVIIYSSRAICCIDFKMPVDQDDELPNGSDAKLVKAEAAMISKVKRKRNSLEQTSKSNKNFEFLGFKDPVLYVGYLSENSLLLIDKQWMDVLQKFEAPIHRHIFGT